VNDLAAWLSSPALGSLEQGALRNALTVAECWPKAPPSCPDHLPKLRPTPAIGEVVVVAAHLPESALWRVRSLGFGAQSYGFHPACLDSIRNARRVALRDLGMLLDARPFAAESAWSADCVFRTSDGVDPRTPLQGRSFELAIGLATASQALGIPLPRRCVASAFVEPDGRLSAATELAAKARAVALGGLAVELFLVAKSASPERVRDLEDARAALVRHGRADVEILEVDTLHDAIDRVFGLQALVDEMLVHADLETASRTAAELFELTVRQTVRLASWKGVRSAVAALCARTDLPPLVAEKARVAYAIAARNEQHPQPLRWPGAELLASIPARSRRIELAAHAIQSAATQGDPAAVRVCLREARKMVRFDAPGPADLKAMGAIGRALAGIGRFGFAARWLEAALRGWLAEGEAQNASFALCELLRVSALHGDGERVRVLLLGEAVTVLDDPFLDPVSRTYLHVAAGAASTLVGRSPDALSWLGDAALDWHQAPAHVQRDRLRWLARAAGASEPALAAQARRALAAERDVYAALAGLDAALASPDGDVRAAMGLLIGDLTQPADGWQNAEARRVVARAARGAPLAEVDLSQRSLAERVAREHR
jgi:hypothetical protein